MKKLEAKMKLGKYYSALKIIQLIRHEHLENCRQVSPNFDQGPKDRIFVVWPWYGPWLGYWDGVRRGLYTGPKEAVKEIAEPQDGPFWREF